MNRRKKIIIVDDNEGNLAKGKNILIDFYDVIPLKTAEKLFDLLDNLVPDLILMDVCMPEMTGYKIIGALKNDSRFMDLPILFLLASSNEEIEHEGLKHGAMDFIMTPFSAPLLLKRIENTFTIISQRSELVNLQYDIHDQVKIKTKQSLAFQDSLLNVLAETLETRENITGGHVARTRKYLEILLNQMVADKIYLDEISSWDFENIYNSAKLHDVGKLAISDLILNKPGMLSAEEFDKIKLHPSAGVETLRKIEYNMVHDDFMRHAILIAGTHHEKWDGTGYPNGLKGEKIPLEGRLMAIADVYDALISHKPYRKAISIADAEKEIAKCCGTHFDPVLVDAFIKSAPKFAKIASKYR